MREPRSTQNPRASLTARAGTAVAVVIATLAGGCITEIVPSEKAANTPGRSNTGVAMSPNGSVPPPAKGGPSSSTRISAAVQPLGAVPYDGLTLPVITPGGRWLFTQTGSLPPWESVLAEPGAAPVPGSAVKAFSIADGKLSPVDWSSTQDANAFDTAPSPTSGLLLGRCAGEGGTEGWVLVERPNPDGSRWIGKLSVTTGAVEWLVQGTDVNAQAILLRNNTLVYTRRKPDQATAELVISPATRSVPAPAAERTSESGVAAASNSSVERVVRREGWKYCQPLTTPDQSMVAVLAIGAQEAQLMAFSTTEVDSTGSPLLIGRETMGALGAAGAFQAVTSVEACPPEVDSGLRSTFLLVNADRQRLAVWDPIKGSMSLLPASVAAGARVHSAIASGLVMASPKGMDFWTGAGFPARLLAGSYIPRSCTSGEGTRLICLSPQTGSSAPSLNAIAVELVAPQPSSP